MWEKKVAPGTRGGIFRTATTYLVGFSRDSTLGLNYDYKLILRSQFFEYLRQTLCKRDALERLEAACLVFVLIYDNLLLYIPVFGRFRY